ncbi:2-oxo acid dehydrogenase subunit E2 [Qipengyuania nanhaisediminis]|uniref:2-oxo acid dehydrogenase subunit E2 n=1 Tax=Qipengyuania nanhaisediminis TaxID=604088 RepID=UPI0038B28112
MALEIRMPALSPTMEEGTLARWLVKVGDEISSGDIMAEIETDKATMEFEAVDEGTLAAILIEEGTENVAVGSVIAMLAEEGEDIADVKAPSGDSAPASDEAQAEPAKSEDAPEDAAKPASNEGAKATPVARRIAAASGTDLSTVEGSGPRGKIIKADVEAIRGGTQDPPQRSGNRVIASPLARKLAGDQGIDLADVTGSGPGGRIVKADIDSFTPTAKSAPAASQDAKAPATSATQQAASDYDAPYEEQKLNNVRKVIARRLTEAKQTVPHIYLTVDIRLDPLLELRKQLNASLEPDGIKLSVNDLIIKALAKALHREPQCNVSFQGDVMHQYTRQDISVAVAAPSGLITPIIRDAGKKSLADISNEMKELAGKAREGKLQPHEYQGGTASLSNLGMFGTKQFDAVINPPQGMILAVGAGEQRPYVVDGELTVATVMSATGSFDHRAIDGVDGAKLMDQLKTLIENPMGLVV